MARAAEGLVTVVFLSAAAFGQQVGAPTRFEVADVHDSAKTTAPRMRSGSTSGGRFEIRSATMVDLIKTSYGFDPARIVGGPSWLETERYDIVTKASPGAGQETLHAMLRSLLADRFKLVVHNDTRPNTLHLRILIREATSRWRVFKGLRGRRR